MNLFIYLSYYYDTQLTWLETRTSWLHASHYCQGLGTRLEILTLWLRTRPKWPASSPASQNQKLTITAYPLQTNRNPGVSQCPWPSLHLPWHKPRPCTTLHSQYIIPPVVLRARSNLIGERVMVLSLVSYLFMNNLPNTWWLKSSIASTDYG